MLQSVMFSDFNAYDFGFVSRPGMGAAIKGVGGKVSFARFAAWGRDMLDRRNVAPMNAHLVRDVVADI